MLLQKEKWKGNIFSMKYVKKILLLVLVFFIGILMFTKVDIHATTSTGGATYDITSSAISKSLGYGIHFKQDIAVTNLTQQQVVSVLDIPSEAGILVVPFTNMTGGRWAFTTVKRSIEIFESLNPGYKVVCAINGGAFDINSNYNF